MNISTIPPPMGKIIRQTGLFNLGMATSLGEKSSQFKPIKLLIKVKWGW